MVLGLGDWLRHRVKRDAPAKNDDGAPLPAGDPEPLLRPEKRSEGRGVDAAKLAAAIRRLVKDHKG
ncbi:hypothetical protein ABTM57_19700, partial [Acinetobacter baumannii]